MTRGWLGLQLGIAWLPMWALFTAVIVLVHGSSVGAATVAALRLIVVAALLGIVVYALVARLPWPHPFRSQFVLLHVIAASAYATAWWLLIALVDGLVTGHFTVRAGPGIGPVLLTGVWLYIVVAGVGYGNLAAQRSARLQVHAARVQLDNLRAQLQPHFLFNALHTVIQLIPADPRAATRATEQLAAVLRTTIEEQRDLIPLATELAFVEAWLAIELLRFGDRLAVVLEVSPESRAALLPSFALQTLLENSLRHGAAAKLGNTRIVVTAAVHDRELRLRVDDDGVGCAPAAVEKAHGSGLRRLRERLRWLYGEAARLELVAMPDAGFCASLRVPLLDEDDIAPAIDSTGSIGSSPHG